MRIVLKILVIILLLLAGFAAVVIFFPPPEHEREFGGTFVRCNIGHLYQAEKKGIPA